MRFAILVSLFLYFWLQRSSSTRLSSEELHSLLVILDLPMTATWEECKVKHKQLLLTKHPDKIKWNQMNFLNDHEKKAAVQKATAEFQEIQDAKEKLDHHFNKASVDHKTSQRKHKSRATRDKASLFNTFGAPDLHVHVLFEFEKLLNKEHLTVPVRRRTFCRSNDTEVFSITIPTENLLQRLTWPIFYAQGDCEEPSFLTAKENVNKGDIFLHFEVFNNHPNVSWILPKDAPFESCYAEGESPLHIVFRSAVSRTGDFEWNGTTFQLRNLEPVRKPCLRHSHTNSYFIELKRQGLCYVDALNVERCGSLYVPFE